MLKALSPLRKLFSGKKQSDKAISLSNEISSLTALKKELDNRVAGYTTTVVVNKR
jgi:hypothetical protein